MKTKIYTMFAALAAILTVGTACAQVQISHDGRPEKIFQPAKGLNSVDQKFLQDAHTINIFEIKVSEIAIQKSSNPFIVQFSKEMITDHTMLLEELKAVATLKGVTLSDELPAKLNQMLMHLENQSSGSFDAAFENVQVAGHSNAATKFKAEIENGNDDDLKAYTVKALPMVDLHYRMLGYKETMMGPTKMQHNG